MPQTYIRGEHEEECLYFPVLCPLGCEAEVLRKDVESHPDTCPLELVECTFNGLGCDVEVPRKDLDEHVQSCMPQHMKAVVKSLVTLQAKHEGLQESHEELQGSYTDSCKQLETKLKVVATILTFIRKQLEFS